MNKKIRKAIVASLGIASLAGVSSSSMAFALTDMGLLSTTVTSINGPAGVITKYAWDGNNNANFGWQHNSAWYGFAVAGDGNVEIKMVVPAKGVNPAFSVWNAQDQDTGHKYNQVGVTSYFAPNPGVPLSFVGYANSGPTGWINGAGELIGSGSGGTVNVTAPTATTGGLADLILYGLAPGHYIMAVGGSCHTANCPSPLGTITTYTISAVQTAVPTPAAVWLFGSALAGLGVFGHRKGQDAA
jgi:hypothetical protein